MSNKRQQRPSIAGAAQDAESGLDGNTDAANAVKALKVMRDRGLISTEEFERRLRTLKNQQRT